ncbi:porin [soil metagenome]
MKKLLIAGAVFGAFAGTAAAQTAVPSTSSVTLYGIMDAGVLRNDPHYGAADQSWNLTSGNRNGSRFGFRGTEDVGGGNKVVFVAEGGINVDDGRSGQGTGTQGRLFGRQIYVGLANNTWGEIRLGRQQAASYELFGQIDPFVVGYNDAGAQATFSGADGLRLDNVIEYRTPLYSGLQAIVGYSFNAGANNGNNAPQAEVPGLNNNQTVLTAGLQYSNGPLNLAASYEQFNCPDTATAVTGSCSVTTHKDQTQWQLGATYDFNIVKVHAMYGQERHAYSTFTTVNGTETINGIVHNYATPDANSMLVGLTVPLGGGRVISSFQHRTDETSGRSNAAENNMNVASVGYEYDLSKRTILWTYIANTNGTGNLDNSSTFDRKQYALGLRHAF